MTGYTEIVKQDLMARAGIDFTWHGESGDSRPPTKHATNKRPVRSAFKRWLFDVQGGICPQCGMADRDGNVLHPESLTSEFSHMVSRGESKRGFVPFNIALQHSACNTDQKDRGPVVHPSTMARPDLVPGEWPFDSMGGFSNY